MRIRAEDTGGLASYLEARRQEGRYLLSYDTGSEYFDLLAIRTFDNEFDALMESYEKTTGDHYTKVVPLEPVLNALNNMEMAFAIPGVEQHGKTLPFNVGQIISDYNYKQDLKKIVMEIENEKVEDLSPLAKTLKYSGMGKVSNDELEMKMAEGQDIFTIGFQQEFKGVTAEAVINCTRSKSGMYYPDNYDIILREQDKEDLKRNYRFSRMVTVITGEKEEKINPTITFKEAFNQMQGRGVFKTFAFVDYKEPKNNRKYEAWEYIDFTKTDAQGNFKTEKVYGLDVEQKVKALSLAENVDYENFQRLCESLKRGNIQSAKYVALNGTQEQVYLVANARFNTINAYDKDMRPISLHEKRKMELDALEHHKQDQKEGQKNEVKQDAPEEKKSRGIRA
ncbi:MAG: hypothetical protein LBF27_13930 [Sphingobacterium sp.]|jgi:hypothetical protein|nr:hypothetical protein [Sphingobacterium sp.]